MRRVLIGVWAVSACISGCYLPEEAEPTAVSRDAGAGGAGGTGGGTQSPDSGTQGQDVPCAVQELMAKRCQGCHSSPPAQNVPMSLVSRDDFARASFSSPTLSMAAQSVQRMKDGARPMPPSGLLAPAEVAVLESWVNDGLQPGAACSIPDAGSSSDGGTVGRDAGSHIDAGMPGEGMPCAVEAVIAQNCRSCHSANPGPSVPMALVTRADFLSVASTAPQVTVGSLSVTRMKSTTSPMPPAGVLPQAQIDVVSAWVSAGMPAGSCTPPADAGVDPFAVPPKCSSNVYWFLGDRGSKYMNPGKPCVSCHEQRNAQKGEEEAPANVGGTVYPTAHEPDLCTATTLSGAEVVLTGADGQVFRVPVNTAGNFYLWDQTALLRPYRAKVVHQGRERIMATPQTSGDCNSCHTQTGTQGAPGRILAP